MEQTASRNRANKGTRWESLRLDALAGLVIFAALVLEWLRVGQMFPQVEFLDWISGNPPTWTLISTSLEPILTFSDGYHSRSLSLLYSAAIGKACVTDITCINAAAFMPFAVTAYSLYAAARLLRLPVSWALAVVLVLLFSEPTFSVLSWQATMHDRLAGVGTFAVLIGLILAVRTVQRSWPSIVGWSVVLTFLSLAAVNTKEPAWIVLPLAATAPLFLAGSRERAVLAFRIVALPIVVVGVHVAFQLAAVAGDPRISAGSPLENARILTTFAVPGGWALGVALALAITAGTLFACSRAGWQGEVAKTARLAAWVGVAALCGWIIPVRTQIPSAFYMFVPLATLSLSAALAIRAMVIGLTGATSISVQRGALVVCALLAIFFVAGACAFRYAPYGSFLDAESSFRAGLASSGALRAQHPNQRVQFIAPPEVYYAYRFMTANPASNFWRMARGPLVPVDMTYGITAVSDRTVCRGSSTRFIDLDKQLQPIGYCKP